MVIDAKKIIGDVKITKIEVRDTDPAYDLQHGALRVFYLVNADEKKLDELSKKVDARYGEEPDSIESTDDIAEYIQANFDVLNIKDAFDTYVIWW